MARLHGHAVLTPGVARAGPQPAPGRASVTPASAAEPHVQVTLRISTDSGESWHVVQEILAGAAPGGMLLARLQQAGMGITRLLLASHILYNVRAPVTHPRTQAHADARAGHTRASCSACVSNTLCAPACSVTCQTYLCGVFGAACSLPRMPCICS